MTNILSFPTQSSPEDDLKENKAALLKLLDGMKGMIERDEINFVILLGQGDAYEGFISWAGQINHVAAQGLLAVGMKEIQSDMLKDK
jgi:hypothetical protein